MVARRLGRTEIEISPIGLGCWQFSQGKGFTGNMWSVIDQAVIDSIVGAALRGGITWFDTAQAYGNGQSERTLSTALHDLSVRPGEVAIATKWLPLLRTAANIPRTIDTRLGCLSGYPIDLFQIHIPWSVSSIQAQITEIAKLVRAGKIRAFGVSNFSAAQMARASAAAAAQGMTLASNQVPISALDRRIERNGVLDLARRSGVTLIETLRAVATAHGATPSCGPVVVAPLLRGPFWWPYQGHHGWTTRARARRRWTSSSPGTRRRASTRSRGAWRGSSRLRRAAPPAAAAPGLPAAGQRPALLRASRRPGTARLSRSGGRR